MNTTNEHLDNSGPDIDADMSCFLSFVLTDDDDLIFDASWKGPETLTKLAQLIYLLQHSDLIIQNILDMDSNSEADVKRLLDELNKLSNRPAISPLEVYARDKED